MIDTTRRPALVIVGAGRAGGKLVEEVIARDPNRFQVRLFGGEYKNGSGRVRLTSLLDGAEPIEHALPPEWFEKNGIFLHDGVKAEHIDRDQRVVSGGGGKVVEPYDVLVLATGARAAEPSIPGSDLGGVFVLHSIDDWLSVGGYARDCERGVVIGDGPLVEPAAQALRRQGLEISVAERSAVDCLTGDGSIKSVVLRSGGTIDADIVVICAGIQANDVVAHAAGLHAEDGVLVDDHFRTSDPHVYALGDCARHADVPLAEQVRRLADILTNTGPAPSRPSEESAKNKVEQLKAEKAGLDVLDDILRLAEHNNWPEMSDDDKQRAKWYGLFFRKQTPGNFMLRVRFNAGRTNARQLRVLADLSDEFGKGFCDLTTRQQIQLRWFTLADTPEIWRRLEEVGLHTKQTGMDNVRGVCGCPVGGLTPKELFDATSVVDEYTDRIVGEREFTNLPRKFNVTISGCLENCCHSETQDIALVPAYRDLDGYQVNGFNVLVGGKQGSGGYRPATPLDVFVRREEAAAACADITRVFRDHGSRANRNRARLAFLIEDRGVDWFRAEVERRQGRSLLRAGKDMRHKSHVDHLGIHPQRKSSQQSAVSDQQLYYVGLLVPVGRITTAQLRGVADLAERYGDGDVRMTVGQNLIIANIPEEKIGALMNEPLFQELPYDPSPIMRGLVACTGNDYCHLALIETKGWAIEVARELERRTAGKKVAPLSIHWSGCSAGCGLHQVATIGMQACRSRVNGEIVDAAHVCVGGRTGPNPVVANDLLYDVPCKELADSLESLVLRLPR